MAEILLARHAQAGANLGNFAVLGNKRSALTEVGIDQCPVLKAEFNKHGIIPEEYAETVLASTFFRTFQTLVETGFRNIRTNSILDESEDDEPMYPGVDLTKKHVTELWVPDDVKTRVVRFIDLVRSGELDYKIYGTHGLFVAGLRLELIKDPNDPNDFTFDPVHGFIPLQASITPVII